MEQHTESYNSPQETSPERELTVREFREHCEQLFTDKIRERILEHEKDSGMTRSCLSAGEDLISHDEKGNLRSINFHVSSDLAEDLGIGKFGEKNCHIVYSYSHGDNPMLVKEYHAGPEVVYATITEEGPCLI
jgi:hypothetical protein